MDDVELSLGDIEPGLLISGIISDRPAKVIAVTPMGGSIDLFYTDPDGSTGREVLDEESVKSLRIVSQENAGPRFDADPDEFRLAAEALRIKYAVLYDPMSAVYSSDINPLPHQIRAVYEDMLPKVPLRFLLADDPGAGKTIMAGLYIKEMMLRSAAERMLIVCPGGLAEQWRDELADKFNLDFEVFQPSMRELSQSGNPFREHARLIVRMDQVARNDEYRKMLSEVSWDIAVVDEAHRMSAHYKNVFGETDYTKRFHFGEILARTSENYLLMTATPHSGKEDDFQLFMTLLDPDRFAGRYEPKRHRNTDTAGLMRRMVKEDLLTFDGKPLFPERHAETVAYELSDGEKSLYRAVTEYVRDGMNAAKKIMRSDKRRGNSIGFALTVLQRRLASSPEAILRSLERRRDRLSDLLERIDAHPDKAVEILNDDRERYVGMDMDSFDDLWDETDEDQQGQLEFDIDQITDAVTGARTHEELANEIAWLDRLVAQASEVRASGRDTKWTQLSDILHEKVLNTGTSELPHKMIVFTEHKDTFTYLQGRIDTLLGRPEAVETIHGGMDRAERKRVQERFVNNPATRILVATDAADEGLNLQRADLMVNYDLPWNPNRIEQRFGRIHRIGQKRVCWLWNLVAKDTREGEVYSKLLTKIETMDKAYSGRLFNVLGDGGAFNGKSLKDLMIEAIRYGDRPDIQARLDQIIDQSVSQGLQGLVNDRSAHPERYSRLDVDEVRRLMEKTRERKLQPGYISAFFLEAFRKLGGTVRRRERNRWQIMHVPVAIRAKADMLDRRHGVADAYERITFDPSAEHVDGRPDALLVAPGVPLLDAVDEIIIEQYGNGLDHGAVFVDRTDSQPEEPVLMAAAEQTITDSMERPVSRHFDYLQIDEHDGLALSPAPPYLDYDAPRQDEKEAIDGLLRLPWIRTDHDDSMRAYVYSHGTKPRLSELQASKDAERRHVLKQVHDRLNAEIEYWYQQYNRCVEDERHGKRGRNMNSSIAFKRAHEYEQRLELRENELSSSVRLHAKPAMVRGMALIIPSRMLPQPVTPPESRPFARNTTGVDRRAVDLTMEMERRLGRMPVEMPHNNKGYDIRSMDPQGKVYFIEVKGRIDLPEADTFTVSANEVAFAQSQGNRHRLSLVRVSPFGKEHDRIRYVEHAFDAITPAGSTRSFNEQLADYWNRGGNPF